MTLLIATPIRGDILAAQVTSGYAEHRALLCQRMPVELLDPALLFSCDIVRARNRVVSLVLGSRPDVDRVLFWDDDNWPRDVGVVQRMIDTGEDFIGCAYTNKRPPLRWIHQELDSHPGYDPRRLLEVKRVGMGFTMLSRPCLERMTAAADSYVDYRGAERVPTANLFGLLLGKMPDGHTTLLSEDFSFSDRWRALGGRIWLYGGEGNIIEHAGSHAWDATQMAGTVVR